MPPMPYAMEIGPVFSLLNDYVEEKQHMVNLLTELRDPTITSLNQTEVFSSSSAKALPNNAITHIEQDWFGYRPGTTKQDPFDPNNPGTTGWWTRWNGDAAGITRETLVRALEVALGVPHVGAGENTAPPEPTRCWRLQFIWACGAPFFQGWVSWQWDEDDPMEGFVSVTFTTPGNGHLLYATPHRPANAPAPSLGYEDPAVTVGNYGMWLIGENETEARPRGEREFTDLGVDVLPDWPEAFVHTHGGVTVVSPAEIDGGVLPAGRPW